MPTKKLAPKNQQPAAKPTSKASGAKYEVETDAKGNITKIVPKKK